MKTMVTKIILVIVMMMAMTAQYVVAQTDLYRGKTEIECAGNHFYVICRNFGNDNWLYFIGNKTNTKINKGAYLLSDGYRLIRDGLEADPAELCEDYEAKLKKILNTIFTQEEIKKFIERKNELDVFSVIDCNKKISDMEFCLDGIYLANIPFERYYRLGELIRTNLEFAMPSRHEERLEELNGGFFIVDIWVDFSILYPSL